MKNVLTGTSLLMVDDDPDALALLEFVTTLAGATVRTASSPGEALAALASFKPDVMLLDISLPEMDGYDLLKAIRRAPAMRNVPAIAVTARAHERDKQRTVDTGFSLHVSKPIDPEALVYLVATLKHQAEASEDPPMLRDLQAVLRALGAHRSLEFLNRRTPYRFTGVYEFKGATRRNVDLFDRLDPAAAHGETTPLGQTFCSFVETSRRPMIVTDAATDARSAEPLRRASVQSYCGVLLRRLDGTPFGSLCHFDLVPMRPTPGALDMLLHAAPLLAATMGDEDSPVSSASAAVTAPMATSPNSKRSGSELRWALEEYRLRGMVVRRPVESSPALPFADPDRGS
jgi:CheY-like chemotaxis protein